MPMKTQLVTVPLGGGLKEDVEPLRVNPPFASAADNAVVRLGGGYQKAPGIELHSTPGSVGNGDAGAHAMVFSPGGAKLILGANGSRQVPADDTVWASLTSGYQNPAYLSTVRAYSPRGHILDVGVCYHEDGYYGVCWRETVDPAPEDPSTGPNDDVGPGVCKYIVTRKDGTLVAGPYTVSLNSEPMTVLPRVECVSDLSGNAVFIFLGCRPNAAGGILQSAGLLYAAFGYVNVSSIDAPGALSGTQLSSGVVGDTLVTWDSHSNWDHDAAYVVFIESGPNLISKRINYAGTVTSQVLGASVTDKVQVYHNDACEVVIVTHSGTSSASAGDKWALDEGNTEFSFFPGSIHGEATVRLYKHATSAVDETVFSGETLTCDRVDAENGFSASNYYTQSTTSPLQGSGTMTVSVLLRCDTVPVGTTFIADHLDTNNGWLLGATGAPTFQFVTRSAATSYTITAGTPVVGTVYAVTASYDGANLRLVVSTAAGHTTASPVAGSFTVDSTSVAGLGANVGGGFPSSGFTLLGFAYSAGAALSDAQMQTHNAACILSGQMESFTGAEGLYRAPSLGTDLIGANDWTENGTVSKNTIPYVSSSGSADYNLPLLCYDPQPWEGHDRSVFPTVCPGLFLGDGSSGNRDDPGASGWSVSPYQYIEEYNGHIEGRFVHTNGLIYPGFQVLENRHSPLMWYGLLTGSNIPSWTGYVGHVPQTAIDEDGVPILAAHVTVPAIKGYKRSGTSELTAPYPTSTVDFQNEGGWPNMDRSVVVVRMSPREEDLVYSVLDQNGTSVVAAGGHACWDGNNVVNYVPRPWITGYTRDTSGAADDDVSGLLMGSTGTGIASTSLVDPSSSNKFFAIKVVLVYTDKNGVEWRSEPSPPYWVMSLVYNSTFEFPQVKIGFNSLAYYRGTQLGGHFDLEMYVTERDDGTTFSGPSSSGGADIGDWDPSYYLCQRSPLLFDGTSFYINDLWEFAHNGSFFRPAIPLYTDTGELAPVLPPASGVMARSGDYAFLVPSEFPYELWPSKPLEVGRGPEFAPELLLNIPSDSGGIVSLAGLNDRLYILCKNGVYAISTLSGPDATGSGSFGPIRRIHLGDGCVNHNCTVVTPAGAFYASKNGMRLVGMDGIVQDVGKAAQDTLGDVSDFIDSVYLREHNEVWWIKPTLSVVLNIDTGAWTREVRTLSVIGADEEDGEVFLLSGPSLYKTDVTSGREYILYDRKMNLSTSWLTFDQASGYFRCRRIHLLIRRTSGQSNIVVKLAYDYDDTVVDTFTFRYYGTSGWSNFERNGQFTVRPSVQKFDAVKITVTEEFPTSTSGIIEAENPSLVWSIAGISLEIASKQGGIKLQQAAKK